MNLILARKSKNLVQAKCLSSLLFSNAVQFINCLLNAYYGYYDRFWWHEVLTQDLFGFQLLQQPENKWHHLLIQIHFLNEFFWDLNIESTLSILCSPTPNTHTLYTYRVSQAAHFLLFPLWLFSTEQPECQLLAFLKLWNPHQL